MYFASNGFARAHLSATVSETGDFGWKGSYIAVLSLPSEVVIGVYEDAEGMSMSILSSVCRDEKSSGVKAVGRGVKRKYVSGVTSGST